MQQGNLDGLCGFYSVVNAITGAANLNALEVETLAQQLRPLIDITEVWGGCSIKTLRAMVTAGIAWVNQQQTYQLELQKIKPIVSVTKLWSILSKSLKNGNVAILGVTGRCDHWTVVKSITKKQMQLVDSDGGKTFNQCDVRMIQARENASDKDLCVYWTEVLVLKRVEAK